MRDSPQGSFDHFEILRTGFHCGPLRASPIQQDFEQRVRILVYADELAVGGHAGSLLAPYFVCAAANEDRNRQGRHVEESAMLVPSASTHRE